jgi:hypothetical protein
LSLGPVGGVRLSGTEGSQELRGQTLPPAWPWSSHAGTIDRGSRPAWLDADRLLSHFDGLGGDALRHYVAITEIDDVEHDADRDGGQAAATVSRR